MQKCFAEFEAKGSDPVWLGVWEYNPRAISFYRKLGFTEVGAYLSGWVRPAERHHYETLNLR